MRRCRRDSPRSVTPLLCAPNNPPLVHLFGPGSRSQTGQSRVRGSSSARCDRANRDPELRGAASRRTPAALAVTKVAHEAARAGPHRPSFRLRPIPHRKRFVSPQAPGLKRADSPPRCGHPITSRRRLPNHLSAVAQISGVRLQPIDVVPAPLPPLNHERRTRTRSRFAPFVHTLEPNGEACCNRRTEQSRKISLTFGILRQRKNQSVLTVNAASYPVLFDFALHRTEWRRSIQRPQRRFRRRCC
jgi:hypothetical protein